jgi:hypothetical protein
MNWVQAIVDELRLWFGGIPTFVEDPDLLLEVAEVREALRASGMTLGDWDGQPEGLIPLKSLSEAAMPVLIVGDSGTRHIVESCLHDFRWRALSVGAPMPGFAPEVVKAIPNALWGTVFSLQEQIRRRRTPTETALLIGRALYGVDLEFLRYGHGWIRLLTHIAVAEEPLPLPIARAIVEAMPPPWPEIALPETLADPVNTRAALRAILDSKPTLYDRASRAEQLLLAELRHDYSPPPSAVAIPDLLGLWEQACQKPQDVLQFGLTYAQANHAGPLLDAVRLDVNRRFVSWLKQNYSALLNTPNPSVLRLPILLDTLDAEHADERTVLFVVDALSLSAWECVQQRWLTDGIIVGATTRAAFAVLPTITSLSRRALFEGKLPSQFSPEMHSPALERKLWTKRYGIQGDYFSVGEATGFSDSLAKGKPRLCVVDVSWDKRGHSIDPRTDSIVDAANTWAGRTPLRMMVQSALASGYKVLLTADHGQVECIGKGRLNIGVLAEERSKRVVLFNDKTVCNNAMQDGINKKDWTDNFRPMGLPQEMFPLFAADYHSFDLKGAATVSHGGLSLDEALVPVVEVWA